jgi:S1-C subfamily serine protease
MFSIRLLQVSLILGFLLLRPSPAVAETSPSIDDVLKAIVRIEAKIPGDARTAGSLGTERDGLGAVIDANGLILTVGYLILEAESATVTRHDGKTFPARIVAYDHNTGFGLARTLKPLGVKPLAFGDSAKLRKTSSVLVAGFGGAQAAMPAKVVARRDYAGYWEYLLENAVFTSPPYPGFGGVALIGSDGTLMGIGSLILPDAIEPGEYGPGNMFIPIDRLAAILPDLIAVGRSRTPNHPWIGLYTEEHRGKLFVKRVAKGGPADRAGIKPDDIVLGLGEDPVRKQADLYRKLWAMGKPGARIPLKILGPDSRVRTVQVESIDRYKWLNFPAGN